MIKLVLQRLFAVLLKAGRVVVAATAAVVLLLAAAAAAMVRLVRRR